MNSEPEESKEIPYFQRLYDRPYVLLVLGLAVMIVFYTLWGMIEVMSLPEATLP